MTPPLLTVRSWDLEQLSRHLQGLIDLELWTIPYYLTAMFSIEDQAADEYLLIQDVVHQEMLHVQLATNIAIAYGVTPSFTAPSYGGAIPHIDFALDTPNPTNRYQPFSSSLGPLDVSRINTMCLIEYPEWDTERQPDPRPDHSRYGSIAEFYTAVRQGMYELRDQVHGGGDQVDIFGPYYTDLPTLTIGYDGAPGYLQALSLIDVITDQGEGQSEGDTPVAVQHRNTADGYHEDESHFAKFTRIRDAAALPAVFAGVADPAPGTPGALAQERLVEAFGEFLDVLSETFTGTYTQNFAPVMVQVGASARACWQRGAIPRFS